MNILQIAELSWIPRDLKLQCSHQIVKRLEPFNGNYDRYDRLIRRYNSKTDGEIILWLRELGISEVNYEIVVE
jgi:hypothetical protein